ncbi:uridine kinase [Nocardioides albertanoniae]|uniref:Uridine kinase n=1 Tax=Nocardioides albertanoniae TaxID=1175486 RepID=A0A543ACB4_9ACTN|nr:ATP-binding protein [Nocardioides albertanoniae]TQL70116.1 uridine kinase [Nocardioides albertanoniae]
MHAQVIVLAGPSGAGKSRLAERLGLPILRLDDFYKDGSDPSLPRIVDGPNAGMVDWDHPRSWHPEDAVEAITSLCRTGTAEVPVYDIAHDGRTGWQTLSLGDSKFFVAEGIFAQDIVADCRELGLLAEAYCVTQSAWTTFWRRLARDLRERRKPPFVLVRRGLALKRAQPQVVADAATKGCIAVYPKHGYVAIDELIGLRRRP